MTCPCGLRGAPRFVKGGENEHKGSGRTPSLWRAAASDSRVRGGRERAGNSSDS
jgi:hypothetical protein